MNPFEMRRTLRWPHVVFMVMGAPALVLFSMGGISTLAGPVAALAWTISIIFGFVQSISYAEFVGMQPNKSGQTSNYATTAWFRYFKPAAPLAIWGSWLAWAPIIAIGSGLAAGYFVSVFIPETHPWRAWSIVLMDLNAVKDGLTIRIDLQFLVAFVIMMVIWVIQRMGVEKFARAQVAFAIGGMFPLLIVVLVPLFTGRFTLDNFAPFVPATGGWDKAGIHAFIGALFLAAWSAYGHETAASYMGELKHPKRDGPRAIIVAGFVALAVYISVPHMFQGVLGTERMQDPSIDAGTGVGRALASMVTNDALFLAIIVVVLMITLVIAGMTAIGGTSRTSYQGSRDGFFPRYLGQTNKNKVPARAMWTDLIVAAVLLMMSDYLFVLSISSVNYVLSHYYNLNAAWIHRVDNPRVQRPFRTPTWVIVIGTVLAYVNTFLIGAGANLWGPNVLLIALLTHFAIVPVFLFRHYVRDKGKFPSDMYRDLIIPGEDELGPKRAGIWPIVALLGGAGSMALGYVTFYVL